MVVRAVITLTMPTTRNRSKKAKRPVVEIDSETLLVVIEATLNFFDFDDTFSLSQVNRSLRRKIDGDDYAHWIQKWRLICGPHKVFSQSSTRFQNPKHLCNYFSISRARASESRKNYRSMLSRNSDKYDSAELFKELTNNGSLILWHHYKNFEYEEVNYVHALLELFPLHRDPMTPLRIAFNTVCGGMGDNRTGYISTDLFGMIWSVDDNVFGGWKPYCNFTAMKQTIEAIFGKEVKLKDLKWLRKFWGSKSFFLKSNEVPLTTLPKDAWDVVVDTSNFHEIDSMAAEVEEKFEDENEDSD